MYLRSFFADKIFRQLIFMSYGMLPIESPSLPFSVAAGISPHRLMGVQEKVHLMAAHGNPRPLTTQHQHHQERRRRNRGIPTTPTTSFNKRRAAMRKRWRDRID